MSRLNYFHTKPKIQKIPIDEYLTRIQVAKNQPDLHYLKVLHKAHLLNIPYENLDIYFNRNLPLDINKFYDRIITNQRGGISIEVNLLFYHLLDALGFKCHLISGRIFYDGVLGPPFDLPLIVVLFNQELWLADVGSLSPFVEPKKIIGNQVQLDYNQYFKFEQDPDENYILKKSRDCIQFRNIYQFELKPKEIIQFMERYNYICDSPESKLRQNKIIFQHTPEGFIKLTDRELIIESKGQEIKTTLLHEDDFSAKLMQYFGLDYDQLLRQRFNQ
ncbi:MAG: arylamine N-acetyltransferase [Bacteroidota bacterium]